MRYVFDFDEDSGGGRELLGGKGIGLAEMTQLGIPVPSGFTITTDACRAYMAAGGGVPEGLDREIEERIAALEERAGKRFGDPGSPLLVSVRSGAAVSMPGMMDTILNLGLSDVAVEGLATSTGDARFALDSYRRLIQMYGGVVAGVDGHRFEQALADLKEARGVTQDMELSAEDLRELVETFKGIYEESAGHPFPQDASEQLQRSYRAVFDSWNSPRAQVYRRTYDIPDDLGTAVNVVQMVFGNRGESSGTGVCFTRDPATGEKRLYGEFLSNAQGEDVVAGIRTPEPIEQMREKMPEAFDQLLETLALLEAHYRDMQDIEFTVEEGRLFILQTRTGKRTAAAALRVAVDMVDEELISREEAVARIDPAQLDQLLHPMIDPSAEIEVATRGLNASPGAASGAIVLDADTAEERGKAGEDVILVRWETTPDDIHGLIHARGVLTAHGGMTSHAAVVARGMGKPCVAGCEGLSIDYKAGTVKIGESELRAGDLITIDGGTGDVIIGSVPLVPPAIDENFGTILGWADELRRMRVRANADTPEDAAKAREFGAEGIGLCRTEHMFMSEGRLPIVREMILARDEEERRSALERLLPLQQGDFEGIFEAMTGFPVTIRLLDPPLHEFLPPLEEATSDAMRERIRALHESNPMLGTRGCRLGLQFPEIYEMQVRAIVRAARAVTERTGKAPLVEIMHPLVGFREELARLRELILAADEEGRRAALDRLLPIQQGDFEGIFEAMAGLPVTIRLLDWPLHEFLPSLEEERDERMRERIRSLQESNPMLGWRACRLGLSFPEIYEMQVRAIVRAAIAVRERTGAAPLVEIMHPLVGFGEELRRLRELTVRVAGEEGELEYLVGTMIELPRACIRADEIAEHADFFSFGTNDLTQTALGISRDDGGRFLSQYLESGVLERDPFETIDQAGVGDLMRIAVERGRSAREEIKLGICGEHGGEPKSVAFCHELGLDYVSCSPYRVPLARLAAAQAALAERGVSVVAIGG